MNWIDVVGSGTVLASFFGVIVTTRQIVKFRQAERDWRRACTGMEYDRAWSLVHVIAQTHAGSSARERLSAEEHERLLAMIAETVRSLDEERTIPKPSARMLEAALSQPSPAGRRNYADKLAREMLRVKGEAIMSSSTGSFAAV